MALDATTWNGGISDDISEVLFDEATIKRRAAELGAQLSRDYAGKKPIIVGILTGAFLFIADVGTSAIARGVWSVCGLLFVLPCVLCAPHGGCRGIVGGRVAIVRSSLRHV